MFAAIRTYGMTDIEELSELVKDGFLPIVESVPGFVAYYVVDAGDGVASSITICEDKAGVDESTSREAAVGRGARARLHRVRPGGRHRRRPGRDSGNAPGGIAGRAAQGPRRGGPCRPHVLSYDGTTLARTAAPAAVRTIVPPGARFA